MAVAPSKSINWFSTFFSCFFVPFEISGDRAGKKRTSTAAAKPTSGPEAAIVAAAKHFSAPHKVRSG
ncbi:hypothetical protein CDL15_Pgr027489 [Punica granatum]|uniref:Uncharacterized protein n=1 Tax=Punica granatum TaxID=22663 RepID=A0A218XK52_PUNGR|nr:hypothetical protein CDL15_Pgr027489 [Punica granatum]PKI69867.1 hypothetical protein CRG98_009742 [Punica granatum]